ncbi:MAG: protein TolR [Devosiaceae bacterium]|nr:protein TolR [Devosiaceae bacterium]
MSMSVAGGGSGGGRRRRRKRNAPMSEINVTPMVDVMLVLLIVFMVAAPLLTVGVPVDLPESQAQSLNIPAEPVTLSVTLNGEIFIGDEQFSLEQAIARVNEMAAQDSEQRIYVRADTSVDYGAVMRVMGALSAAGHSRIGLVTAQETGR